MLCLTAGVRALLVVSPLVSTQSHKAQEYTVESRTSGLRSSHRKAEEKHENYDECKVKLDYFVRFHIWKAIWKENMSSKPNRPSLWPLFPSKNYFQYAAQVQRKAIQGYFLSLWWVLKRVSFRRARSRCSSSLSSSRIPFCHQSVSTCLVEIVLLVLGIIPHPRFPILEKPCLSKVVQACPGLGPVACLQCCCVCLCPISPIVERVP